MLYAQIIIYITYHKLENWTLELIYNIIKNILKFSFEISFCNIHGNCFILLLRYTVQSQNYTIESTIEYIYVRRYVHFTLCEISENHGIHFTAVAIVSYSLRVKFTDWYTYIYILYPFCTVFCVLHVIQTWIPRRGRWSCESRRMMTQCREYARRRKITYKALQAAGACMMVYEYTMWYSCYAFCVALLVWQYNVYVEIYDSFQLKNEMGLFNFSPRYFCSKQINDNKIHQNYNSVYKLFLHRSVSWIFCSLNIR